MKKGERMERKTTRLDVRLIIAGNNDRTTFAEDRLNELAEQIRDSGLLQPITVRRLEGPEELYELIAGERRFSGLLNYSRLARNPYAGY